MRYSFNVAVPALTQTLIVSLLLSLPWRITAQDVKDWQSLEAGLLAIVAAIIGATFLNLQTRQTRVIEQDRITRRLRALRATLPLTLATLSDWIEECGEILIEAYRRRAGVYVPQPLINSMPIIPGDSLAQIERFVEFADPIAAAVIEALFGDAQVFISRMKSNALMPGLARAKPSILPNIEGYIIDAASISARISSLFAYSRRRTDTPPTAITWSDVRQTLDLWAIDLNDGSTLAKRFQGRSASGIAPGYTGRS